MRVPALVVFAFLLAGCGARSGAIDRPVDGGPHAMPQPEVCNGLDDDLNGVVDDGFRDALGRYVSFTSCGRCGQACPATLAHALGVDCALVAETPTCVATSCAPGFALSSTGVCVPAYDRLCLPCADDGDCGDFAGAHCTDVGSESRCVIDCALTCPTGYACSAGACLPAGGSCSCMPGQHFDLACALRDPMRHLCPGSATCNDGTLSTCLAPPEICDHADNDCNGVIDDPYRDARGAYSLNVHDCGDCGVDCTTSGVGLTCGGDPFAPHCVLDCPDTHDGIQPGDHVDADGLIADGCECIVGALDDQPGPVRTSGSMLDVNCDGADGIVVESYYVAPGGDDTGPGSPTRPLATISVGLMRAAASVGTSMPRTHVFIASGVYAESITLPDGVKVHGGYRRDFLSLDPDGFQVEIRAPTSTTAPGGAALSALGAGSSETTIEWLTLRGVDAAGASTAAFGAYLRDPGPLLSLRDLHVRAGTGGPGTPGTNGAPAIASTMQPMTGDTPRAATEDPAHDCIPADTANVVRGGDGGHDVCGGDVSGGAGAAAGCPRFMAEQRAGSSGLGSGAGAGGMGGDDSLAPITDTCPVAVCCGLADFTVWDGFQGPSPGENGSNAAAGGAGRGCGDAFGHFDGDTWTPDFATRGSDGGPGSGGGGGGAGGGAEFTWTPPMCMFADALGGGGGGGGAGGCGGAAGSPGTSGGPSIAIVVRYTAGTPPSAPTIRNVTIAPSDGGRGGDGGAGGDGALGQNGAAGGSIPRSARTTPSLAGGFSGARGGKGGNGGPGGGGGGGCGGASVGIWVTGVSTAPPGVMAWTGANTFALGVGGLAGQGGGGGAAAGSGAAGGTNDLLVL